MKLFVAIALIVGLATVVAPFASSKPDGLERVALDSGFADRAETADAPLGDYVFPGAAAGVLIVFAAGCGIARART